MNQDDIPIFVPASLEFRRHWLSRMRVYWENSAARTLPLILYRDIINESAQTMANLHEDFCSIYVIRSGRGVHVIEGTDYAVARGDVYVMGPGMTHWFRDGEALTADTLHFDPSLFQEGERAALIATPGFHSLFALEGEGRNMVGRRWVHLTPTAYEAITAQIAELRAEWQRGTPEGTLLARVLFLRILIHLSRCFVASQTTTSRSEPLSAPQDDTITAAVRYMEEHFIEPLRIEQVAAMVYLSPDRFTEVFARAMGRTPRDYLRHLRLERALMLLATTGSSVEEVARQSGFGNAAYLARVVKTARGQTPRMMRKERE
jgi:AraC family L-rhamnose operon regulatory protein RhaS